MTSTSEKRIQTTIQSKGKARSGDGWMLVLSYKMPGSNYETTLYGKDWGLVNDWNPGDAVTAVLVRGRSKEGKDSSKDYNYFWDLVELTSSDAAKAGPAPEAQGTKDTAAQIETPQDSIQERIEKGMAFNAAYTILAQNAQVYESNITQGLADIRLLRDRIYHEVIRVPIAPLHYCYQHETPRILSSRGAWGHILPDGKGCVEAPAAPTAPAEAGAEGKTTS